MAVMSFRKFAESNGDLTLAEHLVLSAKRRVSEVQVENGRSLRMVDH